MYWVLGLVLLGGIIVAGTAYYSSPRTKTETTTRQTQATTSKNKENHGTSSNQKKTYPVSVYFSKHPESDNDPSKVFAVSRTSPDLGVGKYAITELLKGPSADETTQGYFATARIRAGASYCDNQDFTLNIVNNIATLKFCRTFDHLGVVADGQADSEIKATLKQFGSVGKVIILNRDNNCEFDLSGMNLCKQ